MEEAGIISGCTVDVDYIGARLPLHYRFTCTAPVAERARFVRAAFEIRSVSNARELTTRRRNVIVEGVGESQDEITRIAQEPDDIGPMVVDENLIESAETRPFEKWNDEEEGTNEEGS